MAQIGSLFVRLGLQSAEFTEGLKRATSQAASGSAAIAKALAAAGAAAAAAAALIVRDVARAAQTMDALGKAAQRVGASVEGLAKLEYAASLSGVAADRLQTALTRLNVGIASVERGTGGAAAALRSLGVTAQDTADQALLKIADAFARLPDSAQKSTLAVQIFGRSGADLIPLLNQGRAGLEAMGAEAERLGLVIDVRAARAAETFNDALTRLAAAKRGVTTQIAAGLLPALAALADQLAGSLRAGEGWVQLGRDLGAVFLRAAEAAAVLGETVRGVAGAVVGLAQAVARVNALDFSGAAEAIQFQEFRTRELIARRRATFAAIQADLLRPPPSPQVSAPSVSAEDGGRETARAVRAAAPAMASIDAAARRVADAVADWQRRLDGIGPQARELLEGALEPIARASEETAVAWQEIAARIPSAAVADALLRADRLAESIAQNIGQALAYGRSLGEALVSSLRAAAAELIVSGLMGLLQGGGRGGLLGTLVGLVAGIPGRAKGGPVSPGRPYWVGERGPEIVVPRAPGVVLPTETALGKLTAQDDGKRSVLMGALEGLIANIPGRTTGEPVAPGMVLPAGADIDRLVSSLAGLTGRIPGRAKGGPVSPGRPYWVGERGPEIVVPRAPGVVLPTETALGGLTVQVDARGAVDPAAVEAAVVRGVQTAVEISRADLASLQLRRLPRAAGAWR